MLLKKIVVYVIIILIIYYVLLHLSYRKTTNQYKYLDLNNDALTSYNFESQFSYKLPIIIWNNDTNINIDRTLYDTSPSFTIKKHTVHNFVNDNLLSYHDVDRLFVIAKQSVTIELYIPKISKQCKYIGVLNHKHIYNYKLNNNQINNIEIQLEPNDILYIPRYWLFNISEKKVDLVMYSTIFSLLSTFQL